MTSVRIKPIGGGSSATRQMDRTRISPRDRISRVHNDSQTTLLINGPNLNLLGTSEPAIYGYTTLKDAETSTEQPAKSLGLQLATFQSDHEGAIFDRTHEARGTTGFIVIDPGGLTHTSVALQDALTGVAISFVDIHISYVHAREEFRHRSFLSDKAEAVICGLGVCGYKAAVEFTAQKLSGDGSTI